MCRRFVTFTTEGDRSQTSQIVSCVLEGAHPRTDDGKIGLGRVGLEVSEIHRGSSGCVTLWLYKEWRGNRGWQRYLTCTSLTTEGGVRTDWSTYDIVSLFLKVGVRLPLKKEWGGYKDRGRESYSNLLSYYGTRLFIVTRSYKSTEKWRKKVIYPQDIRSSVTITEK